jgi:transposase
MTLHPKNSWKVPEETARVARASFRKGNVYMKMYDELGRLLVVLRLIQADKPS